MTLQAISPNRIWLAIILFSTALLGCGGGGGGEGSGANNLNITVSPPNQAILGPLAGTVIRAYLLDDINTIIEGPITANSNFNSLTKAGSFSLELANISDDAWVLVTATGGQDIDANDDGVLDSSPRSNEGTIHAMAKAADWRSGGNNITVLSDIAWLYAEEVASDSDALEQRLDAVAAELISQDINNDGIVDRKDINGFAPAAHQQHIEIIYNQLLPDNDPNTMTLIEIIHSGSTIEVKIDWIDEVFGQQTWPNALPSVNAGTNQQVDEQSSVSLTGVANDVDGWISSYSWIQLSGIAVTLDSSSATAQFTAPALTRSETLTFQLTVFDNEGASSSDTVTITINPNNLAPSAQAGNDQNTYELTTVNLSGSASDSDGSISSYRWSQISGSSVTLSNPNSADASFTAPAVNSLEVLSFQLTVTDNEGATSTDMLEINVLPITNANTAPTVNAGLAKSVNEQTTVSLTGSGSDVDGWISNSRWIQTAGSSVTLNNATSATTNFIAPTLTSSEVLIFQFTVTDNYGATASDTALITVNPVNAAPTANGGIDQSINEQTTVTLSGSGSDTDGSISSYRWNQTAGSSVTLNNATSATANFTAPTTLTNSQVLSFQLTVTDNEGATASDSLHITVNPVNTAPVANSGSDQSVTEQTSVTLSGSGSDSDGSISSYSWSQTGGSNVTINNATSATASFAAPDVASTQTLTFQFTVTDNEGASSSDSVSISVTPVIFSVSGTITAAAAHYSDSDVNNPAASYVSNDAPQTSQEVSNPSTVGGFASAFGTGYIGDRFAEVGDSIDAYEVYLNSGDAVSLTNSDPLYGDLDLYLYSDNDPTNPLAASISAATVESVIAPYAGTFHIVVNAFFGITNYQLDIGLGAPTAAFGANRFDAKNTFVADEIIVEMDDTLAQDPQRTGQQKRQAVQDRLSAMGVNSKAGGLGRPRLVGLGATRKNNKPSAFSKAGWDYGDQQDKVDTLQTLKAIQSQADVKSAGLNYIRQPQAIPNDAYYANQWHYPLINLPQAWDHSTGSDVIVAVIDTGVFMAHPELSANLTNTGYDFISSTSISRDGNGIDSNPDDPGDSPSLGGSSFHGSHVAGTIAAISNNGSEVAGVAWDAKVMPVRVLGQGGGTEYDIMQGVRYAAGLSNDSGTVPAQAADIINMSLGGPGYNATFESTIAEARAAGTVIIAAAGNDASSAASYPAGYNGVVSVSAVRHDKALAYYSNFGSTIDLAAPGGDLSVDQSGDGNGDGVLSTLVDDTSGSRVGISAFYQGTSMAAPHVAGVAALMKSIHPGLTPAEFDNAISTGQITQDLAGDGVAVRNNSYGYGLIDGLMAVEHATLLATGNPMPATISASLSSINFGSVQQSQTLNISNGGGSNLYITAITSDSNWLTVTPASVDANNLGNYTVNVDRTDLSEGSYSGSLLISSDSAGTLPISIALTVAPAVSYSANTGYQWVLLLDAGTMATVMQQGVAAVDGVYSYSFDSVSPGTYYIRSGSDADNDFTICDPGESCGGYPQSSSLTPLTITGETTDIDFSSGYGSGFAAAAESESNAIRRSNQIRTAPTLSGK